MAEASSQGVESSKPIRVDCKPGFVPAPRCREVGEDHSSRRRVAAALKHSHPDTPPILASRPLAGQTSKISLFKLAPGRACLAAGHPAVARELLPHDFTLTERVRSTRHTVQTSRIEGALRRYHFCCAFPRVAPGRCYRLPCPLEPGLSSRARFLCTGDLPSTFGRAQTLADSEQGSRFSIEVIFVAGTTWHEPGRRIPSALDCSSGSNAVQYSFDTSMSPCEYLKKVQAEIGKPIPPKRL